MAGEVPGGPNGDRYVSRYEWAEHLRMSEKTVTELQRRQADHESRIDAMESKWDRYAGPIVVLIVIMGIISTAASVWSALQ